MKSISSDSAEQGKVSSHAAATAEPNYQRALSVLRVAAAFGVVTLHVAGRGMARTDYGFMPWWITDFIYTTTGWCVPMFVMISGALLLSPQRAQSPIVFYRRRMSRILIPLLFWTAFYFGLRACSEGLSCWEVARDIIRGRPYGHMWFLYMIAGLYFVTPILQPFVGTVTRRGQIWIIGALLVMGSAHMTVCRFTGLGGRATAFSMFVEFIPYYLCGYVLSQTVVSARQVKYLGVAVVSIWLAIAICTGLSFPRMDFYFYSLHSPLNILMSLAVFLFVSGFVCHSGRGGERQWGLVRRLDGLSLGIYLIHPLFIFILKEFDCYDRYISQQPLLSIPAIVAVLILISVLAASVLKAIPLVRRVI